MADAFIGARLFRIRFQIRISAGAPLILFIFPANFSVELPKKTSISLSFKIEEKPLRLFIAIPLSDAMKDALTAAQDKMYDKGVRGNFTPRENMHLTLAFIGEYPNKEPVMDALSTVSFSAFSLSLSGMGCFRDLWWAGMDESAPLRAVVRRIRHALAENNIPFDRKRFSPHITLIRKATGTMPGIQIEKVSMPVERILLMRSDRGKHGMIYTEVGEIVKK